MPYTIRIDRRALRELKKVAASKRQVLVDAIGSLATDPYCDSKKLRTPKNSSPLFRLRVGNHRIVYTINDGELLVLVVSVGDRKDIYERLKRSKLL